jgi:hypothetical protein
LDEATVSRGLPRSAVAPASSMQKQEFSASRRLVVTPFSETA